MPRGPAIGQLPVLERVWLMQKVCKVQISKRVLEGAA